MNKQFLRSKKVYAVTKQLVPLKTELHEIGPSEEKKKSICFRCRLKNIHKRLKTALKPYLKGKPFV